MPSVQLKISIREEVLWKLEAAQKKFDARTPNIIASEVIERYLDLWEEAESVQKRKIIKQYVKARKQLDSSDPEPTRESRRPRSRPKSSRRRKQ